MLGFPSRFESRNQKMGRLFRVNEERTWRHFIQAKKKLLRDAALLRTVVFNYVEHGPLTPATYGFRSFLSRSVAKLDR